MMEDNHNKIGNLHNKNEHNQSSMYNPRNNSQWWSRTMKYSVAAPTSWPKKPWFPQGALLRFNKMHRSQTNDHKPVSCNAPFMSLNHR